MGYWEDNDPEYWEEVQRMEQQRQEYLARMHHEMVEAEKAKKKLVDEMHNNIKSIIKSFKVK